MEGLQRTDNLIDVPDDQTSLLQHRLGPVFWFGEQVRRADVRLGQHPSDRLVRVHLGLSQESL